jgi:hypothetical protein
MPTTVIYMSTRAAADAACVAIREVVEVLEKPNRPSEDQLRQVDGRLGEVINWATSLRQAVRSS